MLQPSEERVAQEIAPIQNACSSVYDVYEARCSITFTSGDRSLHTLASKEQLSNYQKLNHVPELPDMAERFKTAAFL